MRSVEHFLGWGGRVLDWTRSHSSASKSRPSAVHVGMTATALVQCVVPLNVAVQPQRGCTGVSDLDQRFAKGVEDALADAYAAHASLVYTFCMRRLDAESASDVTQEVFVSAWRSHHRFDPSRGSLRAWLMTIARNRVIDLYRHRDRRPRTVPPIEGDHHPKLETTSIEISIGRIADRMVLAEALTELPDRARTVIEMSFFEQLTHQEIAERTGIPLGTIKSDIRRSLEKLRRNLEDDQGVDDVR